MTVTTMYALFLLGVVIAVAAYTVSSMLETTRSRVRQ